VPYGDTSQADAPSLVGGKWWLCSRSRRDCWWRYSLDQIVGHAAQPVIAETVEASLASRSMDMKGMPATVNACRSALPLLSLLLGCG